MRSDSSARAVSMMIGIAAVVSVGAHDAGRPRGRRRAAASGPARCRSGGRAAIACSASRPDATRSVIEAGFVEIARDQLGDIRIVFDDQDARRHAVILLGDDYG